MDSELKMDAELYKSEIETEWIQIEPVLQRNPDMFPGYDKESFLRMYNYACTRCFGWTLPSTMMVPLADFMNHLPIDTSYDVYSKRSHEVKQSVNSEKTHSSFVPNKKTDYSAIYVKEFKEDSLDPHFQALIKGKFGAKRKAPRVLRETIIQEIRHHMEQNMKHFVLGTEDQVRRADIWQ